MRTDGVDIAPEAMAAARRVIEKRVRRPLSARTRRAATTRKAKNAQEAHEAIRPTDCGAPARAMSRRFLDRDQARLYELIWKRTVASQMASAELERTTIDIGRAGPEGQGARSAPPAR